MKDIYKIILSAAILILVSNCSFAQTYTLLPNDTVNVTGIMEDLETLTIQQLNISNTSLTLEWQKISESVPLNWETNVCDNVICYASLINGGTMNPVIPGDYAFLLVHITPHVNYGTATIRYTVWDISFPLQKDTLTFILTVNSPTGLVEDRGNSRVSLNPNPASDLISIKNETLSPFTFTISEISGKIVESGFSNTELISVNTQSYKNGMYYLSVKEDNQTIKTAKFIILK